jgi:Methyltransferase domain
MLAILRRHRRPAMNKVVARLGGARLKEMLARRVRREVGAQVRPLSADLRAYVSSELARQAADLASLRSENAELRESVTSAARRNGNAQFTTQLVLGEGRRRSTRSVTRTGWRKLAEEISTMTGADESPDWRMRQALRTLLDHETRGLGRIAGSTYNILGKLTTPTFLDPPDGPILEIGTLYGLFSPALVKQFRQLGQFRQLTVIDPLVGHQVQTDRDEQPDFTGTPVTAEVARHNFAVCGLSADDVQLIEGYSTDPAVQAQISDREFAVVVVDGDHSEEGVYADLCWVETIVAPGGIVVMDDFGDPAWAGVERATRRYLADGGRLELLGQVATSAYLRRSVEP